MQELKSAGYDPHFIQVLHFKFINPDLLSTALYGAASTYSGVFAYGCVPKLVE